MDVDLDLRDATDADLQRIVSIYNASIPGRRATADLQPVSVEDRRTWFAAHTPERRPIWVASPAGGGEDGPGIIGWLSYADFYGRPAYGATAEISVYVDDAWQGRGVARRLVARAVEVAPSLGLRTLLAFVFDHNEPSLRLFEGFGFVRWAHLPRIADLDGVERGVVIQGLHLSRQPPK